MMFPPAFRLELLTLTFLFFSQVLCETGSMQVLQAVLWLVLQVGGHRGQDSRGQEQWQLRDAMIIPSVDSFCMP